MSRGDALYKSYKNYPLIAVCNLNYVYIQSIRQIFIHIYCRSLSESSNTNKRNENEQKRIFFLEASNLRESIQSYYQVSMYTCSLYVWHVRGIGAGQSGTVPARHVQILERQSGTNSQRGNSVLPFMYLLAAEI